MFKTKTGFILEMEYVDCRCTDEMFITKTGFILEIEYVDVQ